MQQASVSKQSSFAARRPGARLAWIGKAFLVALAVGVLALLVPNAIKTPSLFIQIVLSGLQLGFVYAMIALGYTMVYGIVKLINFAHGDIFMVGAFVSYYLVARFQFHMWPAIVFPGFPTGLALLIGLLSIMIVCMLVCVAMAVTIERVAYKPLRDAPRIAALITAIGVSFFLEFFGALYFVFSGRFIPYIRPFDVVTWYVDFTGIHRLVAGQTPPANVVTISNIFLIIVATSIIVQLLLQYLVKRTKLGKSMRAASFDKPTARLMGINVDQVISFTFAVGAAFAGPGRHALRHRLSVDLDSVGHPAGPQGVRRRGTRRHRQHPGRVRGGPDHGAGRSVDHGVHLHTHARRGGVHTSYSGSPGSTDRHLRRA